MTDVLTRTQLRAAPFEGSVAADLVLAVAPTAGRFEPLEGVGPQAHLRAGDLIGYVTGGRGRTVKILCPIGAEIGDFLARPGQAVTRGQAVVWLRREERSL